MKSENNLKVMKEFNENNLPNLDKVVLAALELFSIVELPKIKIPYKRPLIVGSGNAEATGRIIFEDKDAVFASESNFEKKLKNIKEIDGVVLISASGGKHGPKIAKVSKKYKKHLSLITNTKNSLSEKYIDDKHKYDEFIFPKNREPYTYNTSTYMGMILGKTGENAGKIKYFIEKKINSLKLPNFRIYNKFYIIVPVKFNEIKRMLTIKFIELFGREISRDVETIEYIKHATTIIPSENELFISFGEKNSVYGKERFNVPLPSWGDYGAIMAIAYYVIGKIQDNQKPYFKKNINKYVMRISKFFGEKIEVIVE